MTYELAPATVMIAVLCACCSRPLVDSVSVETGMGPVCRKKHGYAIECSPETRAMANKLVHEIACEQTGEHVPALVNALRALGFTVLADRIEARIATVRIERVGETIVVRSPYSESALPILRSVPGRRFEKLDANGKKDARNVFPATSAKPLFAALAKAFPGATAAGPKGLFTLAA